MKLAVVAVVVLVIKSASSIEFCSNVLIQFEQASEFSVRYTINPIKPGKKVLLLKDEEMSFYLSFMKFGANSDWWGLNTKKRVMFDSILYERNEISPLHIYKQYDDNESYSFLEQTFDCNEKRMEIELKLIGDKLSPTFMSQYGCKNSRITDEINNNIIYFIVFKGDPYFDLNIGNSSAFRVRTGILKATNIAMKNKTFEQNEIIFNHLIEYCRNIASVRESTYESNFDKAFDDLRAIEILEEVPNHRLLIPIIIFTLVATLTLFEYAEQVVFT